MTDLIEIKPEPISASADGSRNARSLYCDFTSQSMNYAACLWRQGVLGKPNIKTPADWSPCLVARNCNRCTAMEMRSEEEVAGKAIYFTDRHALRTQVRRWGDSIPAVIARVANPVIAAIKTVVKPSAPKPLAPKSMLDAVGSAGDFSDALTEAAKAPTAAPQPTRVQSPLPTPNRAGESPLDMARRIAASKLINR